MSFEKKKIDIYPHNVGSLLKENESPTVFVNGLIEKWFSNDLIKISGKTKAILKELSSPEQLDIPISEVIDLIVNSFKFKVEKEVEKTELILRKQKTKKINIKAHKKSFVKDW